MNPLLNRSIRIFLISFILFTIFSSLLRVDPTLAILLLIIAIVGPMAYVYYVYQRGALMTLRGDVQGAITHYERVLNLGLPMNRAFLLSRLASLKHANGDTAGAIDAYTQAIQLAPQDPTLYAVRSALHISRRDFSQALQDANKLLELRPDSEVGYGNRANANIYLGNYDAAIADCNAGLTVQNSTPVGEALLYNNRGTAERMLGHLSAALSDYNRALAITIPEAAKRGVYPAIHTNQGFVYALNGDNEQARAFFRMALRHQSEFTRAQAALAALDYLEGNSQAAVTSWRSLLDRDLAYGRPEDALRELQFPPHMADAARAIIAQV